MHVRMGAVLGHQARSRHGEAPMRSAMLGCDGPLTAHACMQTWAGLAHNVCFMAAFLLWLVPVSHFGETRLCRGPSACLGAAMMCCSDLMCGKSAMGMPVRRMHVAALGLRGKERWVLRLM